MATTVKYYYGTTFIDESSTGPDYPISWTTAPVGDLALTAKVFVDGVEQDTSPIVNISVSGASVPTYTPEAETTDYMNAIAVPNDTTVLWPQSPQEVTGEWEWYYVDKFIKKGKTDGWFAKGKLLYLERGDNFDKQKINTLAPTSGVNNLQYQHIRVSKNTGGWAHNAFGALPSRENPFIEINNTYGNLGLTANNISVGFINLSNGRGETPSGNHFIYGQVGGGGGVQLGISRNEITYRLTKDPFTTPNPNLGNTTSSLVSTIISDNVLKLIKDGVKIEEHIDQNNLLPTENIRLHTINEIADRYSSQSATFYWIGEGLTETEAVSLSNAMNTLANDLNLIGDMTPAPVLSVDDIPVDSQYWPTPYKSSEWPEFGISSPYFVFYSTDHNGSNEEVRWATIDDLDFNGFQDQGAIPGAAGETPDLFRVPAGESAATNDEIFLTFHNHTSNITGINQSTHLLTTSGGALPHLATWTDRGETGENAGSDDHLGYWRTDRRGANDYIATHLSVGGADPTVSWSVASDPASTFTRLAYGDLSENMPTGLTYAHNQMCRFIYNSQLYAVTRLTETATGQTWLYILSLDNNRKPDGVTVKRISSPLEIKTVSMIKEADILHIYISGGDSTDRYDPLFKVKYDLTQL